MRASSVIARAALVCGLAGAAWCALATLDPNSAHADDRPATVTEQPGGLLDTVRDVVDEVLPPAAEPDEEPDSAPTDEAEPRDEQPADEPADEPTPVDEDATPPRDDTPVSDPPASEPVVELPSVELPVELPGAPPTGVITPPIVVEVPALAPPAQPTPDPAPTQTPAPVVIALPIIGPTTQPADTQTRISAATELAATADRLSVPLIGPVLGRMLDDGIHPPEPIAPPRVKVSQCGGGQRTLEDVRRALRAVAAEHDRRAGERTTRPCPGVPLGPDADAAGMAAMNNSGASSSDQLLGDTPGVLVWPVLQRLYEMRARSTIPASALNHLDPRPA